MNDLRSVLARMCKTHRSAVIWNNAMLILGRFQMSVALARVTLPDADGRYYYLSPLPSVL